MVVNDDALAERKREFYVVLDRVQSPTLAARELGMDRQRAWNWARQIGFRSPYGRSGGALRRHPGREEFERLRLRGLSRKVAAARVGVNIRTAQDWDWGVVKGSNSRKYQDGHVSFYSIGQVRMEPMENKAPSLARVEKKLHARFLSIEERETIHDMLAVRESFQAIGRALRRPASTISREVSTNRGRDGIYRPYAAHRSSATRRPRPKARKLIQDGPLRGYVLQKLALRWSPEQICHALRKEYPHDGSMKVCVETIYQALYYQAKGALKREVQAAMRSGRTRRRPLRDLQARRPRFRDPMIMISDRPAEIADRAVPGHWEGDLITGRNNGSAIATLVERTTRYTMLVHLPGNHEAETVRDALIDTIKTLPGHLRGSLTWDQGAEMARHRQIRMATDMEIYFCDPGSPWQRGTNENTNGLLRQYFPKGSDLSVHTPEDLTLVAQQLNGRPRKTLGWETPAERLRDLLLT